MLTKANCDGDTLGESSGETVVLGEWQRGNVGLVWTIILFLWDLVAALLDTDNSFLNCCKEVNEGSTDWLRLRCKAALLSVVSEILLDIPRPIFLLKCPPLSVPPAVDEGMLLPPPPPFDPLGNSGRNGLVGVGGGLV